MNVIQGGQGREPEDLLGAAFMLGACLLGAVLLAVVLAVWGSQ